MPLTLETQAVLKAREAAGWPEYHKLTPPEARETMARMRALMPQVEPEAVASVEDRTIPGPAGAIPVRIYRPAGAGPFPAVVFFHGGGWVLGDLESHDATCRSLTNVAGCVVVAVDYRLAPEHRFPAAADDSYAAACWVAEHAAELSVDASRLAVLGDSAGGNLAAVVPLMARDRGGPAIRAQVLVYPVTDYDFGTSSYRNNGDGAFGLTEVGMRWYWGCYLSDPEDGKHPYASPLRAESLSGLPPALVITAEFDPLRDEGEAYARRLEGAGVATTLTRYDGVIHGFLGQAAVVPEGRRALEQIGRELRARL
jgi:acetyl esterase